MQYNISDLQAMATSMAASVFFRIGKEKRPMSPDQILTLMLMSISEGKHPALGVKDYDIIDGRPAKKTDSMLRDLLLAGGSVQWHALTDILASATFSHPSGGTIKIDWDIERAKKAGLIGKDVWQKYKRQMLRSRCVSEGVRTVYPAATSTMYCVEELQDMSPSNSSTSVIFPANPDDAEIESLNSICEIVAKQVTECDNLDVLTAIYHANTLTFARINEERPEWGTMMGALFEKRAGELSNEKSS